MLDGLVLVAVVLPCWYAYKRSVARGLVAINHVGTLSFGFLFYWVLPILIGTYGPHLAPQLSSTFTQLFDPRRTTPYLLACVVFYGCFLAGDCLGIRCFRNKAIAAAQIPRLALSLVTVLGCLLALYTMYALRAELLLPYSTALTFKTARGTLTSCILLLGIVALMFIVDRPQAPWRERLKYLVPFIAGCGLLLLLGSRLYVASFLLMFAIYRSNLRQRFKLRTVLLGTAIFTVLVGMVGVWRSGERLQYAFVNVAQEPVMTSISLMYYLRHQGIAWTNSPVYLASDFANLIPALILPGKASLLKRPPVYHPLGGLHSFVSFNLNFGVLGTAVFWFLLPIAFRYLKSRSSGTLWATMYIMCSAWMAFTFFRDPFKISLVKAVLENSILIPIGVVALGRLLSSACMPAGKIASPLAGPQAEAR
jgi:oligosaccharide repeat unit polymerase